MRYIGIWVGCKLNNWARTTLQTARDPVGPGGWALSGLACVDTRGQQPGGGRWLTSLKEYMGFLPSSSRKFYFPWGTQHRAKCLSLEGSLAMCSSPEVVLGNWGHFLFIFRAGLGKRGGRLWGRLRFFPFQKFPLIFVFTTRPNEMEFPRGTGVAQETLKSQ